MAQRFTSAAASTFDCLLGSEEAARFGGQFPLPYSPSLQTLEIVKAETRKADGTIRPVALDTIQERLLPAAQGATTFDDRRVKIVVLPDLAAGDTLVASIHSHNLRAYFPGHYINHFTLIRAFPWTQFDQTISYTSTWSLNDNTIHVRRELVSTITAAVCEPARLTHMAPMIAAIKADLSRKITLADD